MKIIVASKNPIKITSAKDGFEKTFPASNFDITGLSVPSGVADQPMTDQETLDGAMNRANNAMEAAPDADYWIGLEGGIENRPEGMVAFAWIVVKDKNRTSQAKTAAFVLPPQIQKLVNEGHELGHADDLVFGVSNSKHSSGAVGLLTDDLIDRAGLYLPAVILALIPFKKPEYYPIN